jgi:hypothetical protein
LIFVRFLRGSGKMKISLAVSSILFLVSHFRSVLAQSSYSINSFDAQTDNGLTPACNNVYIQAIPNCQPSDFLSINPCSANCIEALTSVQTEAQAACAANNITQTSLLRFFRDGLGVQELCTNQKSGTTGSQTTLTTATRTASTPSQTSTPSAEPVMIAGGDRTMDLPRSTVIAIVIGVSIAIAIFAILAICLYRKYYMG